MNKQILSEMNDKNVASLIEAIEENYKDCQGSIFYKFPSIKEFGKNALQPDVLVISEKHGVIIIVADDMTTQREESWDDFIERKDSIEISIYTGLLKNKNLKLNNRTLRFDIHTIGFCPNLLGDNKDENVYVSAERILSFMDSIIRSDTIPVNVLEEIVASLESSSAIIKPKERILSDNEDTKAKLLKEIEAKIARFDDEQRLSALSLLDGPQRIRGLAGSGKTIILCLKAAHLHMMYPDKNILYTFYTKSLYDDIVQLITRFYNKMTDDRPDFIDRIHVLHAWGGKSVPGVYYEACKMNGVSPVPFSDARLHYNPFEFVCSTFIKETKNNPRKAYDYILMDEAQDFPVSFYQLCRAIVEKDHLIWCYDELQNIFNVELQNTKKTFSNDFDSEGIDLVAEMHRHQHVKNDLVLHKSYRNVKTILLCAVALGFGIYNDKLVQSLENNNHWEDLGFTVISGDCSKAEEVVIERAVDASPLLVDETKLVDCVEVFEAADSNEEIDWIANKIDEAIRNDHLLPDDIAVICLDEGYAIFYMDKLERKLSEKNIGSFNIMDKNYIKGFRRKEKVTLSSISKAKGNEAAMVFVCGCDVFEKNKDLRSMRNKIFTAFTRAKVWLRISGTGKESLKQIIKELDELKKNDYKLCFYNKPTHLLNRDWNENTSRTTEDEELKEMIIRECKKQGITTDEYLRQLQKEMGKD